MYLLVANKYNLRMSTQISRLSHAQRTEISDAKMLAAAVDLIVTRGVQGTTLKEVGTEAGYSRGLAGYRFGSKTGLFEFVLRALSEQWLMELTEVTQGKVGFDAIAAATNAHLLFCRAAPKPVKAFYALWFAAADPEVGLDQMVSGIHERRQSDVVRWIKSDQRISPEKLVLPAEGIAAQYVTGLIGIVYQWVLKSKDMKSIKYLHEDLKVSMAMLLGVSKKDL